MKKALPSRITVYTGTGYTCVRYYIANRLMLESSKGRKLYRVTMVYFAREKTVSARTRNVFTAERTFISGAFFG